MLLNAKFPGELKFAIGANLSAGSLFQIIEGCCIAASGEDASIMVAIVISDLRTSVGSLQSMCSREVLR